MELEHDVQSIRRKLSLAVDDLREIRDQGKKGLIDPMEVWLFMGMMSSIQSLYQSFDTMFHELCDIVSVSGESATSASDNAMRANAKRYFHESNGYLASINEARPRPSISSVAETTGLSNSVVVTQCKTKLPMLELPKFKGERQQWPRFKDTFTSLIKDDPQLRDIDKFHYLVRSLEGSALSVIALIPVMDANFSVAWTTLIEVYDNKRLLATAYLDQLMDTKRLTSKPNAATLAKLVADLSENVAAFRLMDVPERTDFLYFYLASRCLDQYTREQFELQNTQVFPTFDQLIKYLRSRCTAAELACGTTSLTLVKDVREEKGHHKHWQPRSSQSFGRSTLMVNSNNSSPSSNKSFEGTGSYQKTKRSCYVCKGPHTLPNCVKFSSVPVAERHRLIRTWKGCRNCLHSNHNTPNCSSRYTCKFCRGKHHSLLHGFNPGMRSPKAEPSKSPDTGAVPASYTTSPEASRQVALNTVGSSQLAVMLGTAVCHIADNQGNLHQIRLAIDSGSHFSFITRSFAKHLGLNVDAHSAGVWGIGETPLLGFKGRAQCSLSPIQFDYPELCTTALVVDTITSSLPGFHSEKTIWQPYFDFDLADPEFWVSRPIDFLLGCDLFPDILTGQLVSVLPNMPKLLGTVFGFTVLGHVRDISEASSLRALHMTSQVPIDSLNEQLCRFWELEEPAVASSQDPDDERCEELFRKTHYRLPTGRYVVKMPFKIDDPQIFGTHNMAMRRLEHLESKLLRNPDLRRKYNDFMHEYLKLGHMVRANQPGKVFIPHHCVFKGEGESSKFRVVFDAAARTSSGSLNDHLLVGPKLQTNMVDISLNFRQHKYVFTTDVVKMFRQVLVDVHDRDYLHILWRFDPADAVEDFELQTVTYGTAPAPYLAIRAVRQVVEDEGNAFPLGASAIHHDMYVDDLATGAKSLEEALALQHQVIALLAKGQFTLDKWAANHPLLLQVSNPQASTRVEPVSLTASDDTSIKILGLQWDPVSDSFSYKINLPLGTCTKRAVLSAMTKIYDPLGYIGPTVVLAKVLIQEAWKLGLSWDQEFPISMKERWLEFVNTMSSLGNLRIPRWIVPNDGPFQILIFADASERAYCAAAYLRSMTTQGAQVHLLFAKTKLAPVKTLTIPRLELCAALLAGRVWLSLYSFCQRLPSSPSVSFYSDSMIVLAWLHTPSHRLKTFVANRVEKINELTHTGKWYHVASCDNPSDLGSRGVNPEDLMSSSLWFNGPSWAQLEPTDWPVLDPPFQVDMPELKNSNFEDLESAETTVNSQLSDSVGLALLASSETPNSNTVISWFSEFSCLTKLLKTFAFVLRFIDRVRKRSMYSGPLNFEEYERSSQVAIKLVQSQYYFKGKIPASSTAVPKELLNLNPFFNEAGVLLVGGRLKHSQIPYHSKHPVILPGKSHIASLIVKRFHLIYCHCGSNLLLATLRNTYWITGARSLVRQIVRQCVKCRKFDAQPIQPPMGDLPAVRFKEGNPFLHVGTDFAGPFLIRDSLRRKANVSKAYLCVFVCLSTKAIHIELVSSLSTEAFCAALDRFIGRRGLPEQIVSDNGTNFKGAANLLKELYDWYSKPYTQRTLQVYAMEKAIKWTFSPPHGPNFGGIWEAGVKSIKRLLRSVYGDNTLTFEHMSTWLIRIEAILNSRPLCPMSCDISDLDYLSPGHFLVGRPLLAIPEKSLLNIKENRLSRWEALCQKTEHFWNRWRMEYLTTLQTRVKWCRPSYNLKIGDLVILKEDSAPRLRWPVGRVVEVFPGSDNVVRVALVQCRNSILKRPSNKLIPLFLEETSPDPKTSSYEIGIEK